MRPLSDFFPRIGPHVVGCPEPTMAQALLDSAIAFCDESLVQRESLDTLRTYKGMGRYELEAPKQQQVSRIISVSLDWQALQAIPADMTPPSADRVGKPTSYRTTRTGSQLELVFHPTPDGAYSLTVDVALRPIRSATHLEDDLYELWVEPVVAGAIARITAIPNQPFSDAAKSQMSMMTAFNGIRRARAEGAVGRVRSSLSARVRHNKFA